MAFLTIPSIDVREGRCVRLYQGDYARETVFYADPLEALRRWFGEGAEKVHVVDLDGARGDVRVNAHVLDRMLGANPGRLEIGGGVRSIERAARLIESGAWRVVFGTAAVRRPEACIEASGRWPDAVAVGLDARGGNVAIEGWTEQTSLPAVELAERFAREGVRWFVYTDIERDGTLTSPNFGALRSLIDAVPAGFIASGGVSSLEHVLRARDSGAAGAIVGSALYDGRVSLPRVLEALRAAPVPAAEGLGSRC